MSHRGRHRQVAHQRWSRRTETVATVVSAALIAPLAFSGPVASQAETTTQDTLANHVEWLLSAADPAVAAEIAGLKATLAARGVAYDPADVVAYRMPTVEGFTTFVTASPDTMAVRPNPGLLERSPEGAAPVDPAEVLERLVSASPSGGPGVSVSILGTAFNQAWDALDIDDIPKIDVWVLVQQIEEIIAENVQPPELPNLRTLTYQIRALTDPVVIAAVAIAAYVISQVVALIDTLPPSDALVQAVVDAAGYGITTVEGLKQYALDLIASLDAIGKVYALLNQVPTDPYAHVARIEALIAGLGPLPSIDAIALAGEIERIATAELDGALLSLGLPKYSDLELSAIVTEVVPLAGTAPPGPDEIMANPNLPEGARDDNNGSSANWSRRAGDCFKVGTEAFWRVVCWRIDGQQKDSDSSHNFWQLHVDASGKSVGYRKMERMWVEARPGPHGASNQSWNAIAKPSAQYGGAEGCTTSGENVSVASGAPVQVGFGFYWERTSCENYYPKSYGDDDGHWASVWEGNPNVKPEVHRAVIVKVPVKTPADKGVMWEFLTGQRTA